MPTIKELRDKRAKAIKDARSIYDAAAGRSLTSEERTKFDAFMTEARTAKTEADTQEADERRKDELSLAETDLDEAPPPRAGRGNPNAGDDEEDGEARGRGRDPASPTSRGRGAGGGGGGTGEARTMEYRMPNGRMRRIQMGGQRSTDEYRSEYGNYLRSGRVGKIMQRIGMAQPDAENRDLVVDNDTQAGYLVTPQQMAANMIRAVDNAVFIRQMATVYPVQMARSLGAVSLDADPDDGEWTAECKTGSADSGMKFGKRELNPSRLSKSILIGRELLRMSPDVESLVVDRLAYKLAVTEEKNFITGDGAEKPLGLMVASNDGIPTSRDVSTGNTTTAIGADNLIRVKQSLKVQYRNRAVWMFHRDAVTQCMLLKDANGQYMWRQGLTGSDPDTLLGRPVYESEYMPNTFTSGKYVGLLGDLSFYWIADALDMLIQRSEHVYIIQDKVVIIVRKKLDAMPVLAEPFARVKLG